MQCSDSEEEDWNDTSWSEPVDTEASSSSHTTSHVAVSSSSGPVKQSEEATSSHTAIKENKSKDGSLVSRMQLNDTKAGMQGLDKEKINKIIHDISKGSKFYENELKKEEQVNKRIEEQRKSLLLLTEDQIKQGEEESDKILQELEDSRDLSRTIIHIDMDAFYAAVEMREDPSLRDKPMAVGGMGMLSTSNYLARRYGVRAAMPGFIAKKLCPDLIIVRAHFDKYKDVSQQVRNIISEYDPNFSPMSLDEAYLDITNHLEKREHYCDEERTYIKRVDEDLICNCNLKVTYEGGDQIEDVVGKDNVDGTGKCTICDKVVKAESIAEKEIFGKSVEEAVREIRFRVEQKTQLTASAGIAPNMMLAKVCSDKNKPNGQYRIQPTREAVMKFIKDLPIRKICGIGKVSERMLAALDVTNCTHLYEKRGILHHLYSNISSNYFLRICLGIGSTQVEREGERKSMSTERTFNEINKPVELYKKCYELCQSLSEDLKEEQIMGKTVTLKLKTVKFEIKSRAQTLLNYTAEVEQLYQAAKELLKHEIQAVTPQPLRLRLMGVRMSNLLNKSDLGDLKQGTITDLFKKLQEKQQIQGQKMIKQIIKNSPGRSKSRKSSGSTLKSVEKSNDNNVNECDIPDHKLTRTEDNLSCDTEICDLATNTSMEDKDNLESDIKYDNNDNHPAITSCILDSKNIPTDQKERDETDNSLVCPICKSSNFTSLVRLNEHMDLCLFVTNDNKNIGNIEGEQGGSISCTRSTPSAPRTTDNYEAAMVCPVCNIKQSTRELSIFNNHVDACLNRGTIKEILKEQSPPKPGQKRLNASGTESQKSNKKRRAGEQSIRTFFKK